MPTQDDNNRAHAALLRTAFNELLTGLSNWHVMREKEVDGGFADIVGHRVSASLMHGKVSATYTVAKQFAGAIIPDDVFDPAESARLLGGLIQELDDGIVKPLHEFSEIASENPDRAAILADPQRKGLVTTVQKIRNEARKHLSELDAYVRRLDQPIFQRLNFNIVQLDNFLADRIGPIADHLPASDHHGGTLCDDARRTIEEVRDSLKDWASEYK